MLVHSSSKVTTVANVREIALHKCNPSTPQKMIKWWRAEWRCDGSGGGGGKRRQRVGTITLLQRILSSVAAADAQQFSKNIHSPENRSLYSCTFFITNNKVSFFSLIFSIQLHWNPCCHHYHRQWNEWRKKAKNRSEYVSVCVTQMLFLLFLSVFL